VSDDCQHHPGLAGDLQKIDAQQRARRQMLTWIASGYAAAFVAACRGVGTSYGRARGSSSPGAASACIENPAETSGPFPADGSNFANRSTSNVLTSSGIVRSDIRSSFGDSSAIARGVPLELAITLVNSNGACAPLQGHAIYLWHCDRSGDYSLYSSSLRNENYLRGVQVTDPRGQVKFTTIYPACYAGRYPHIHFEIYRDLSSATSYRNSMLVSQMAMPRDTCQTVYKSAAGYSRSYTELSDVTVSSDNVFEDSSAAQIARQTPVLTGSVSAGYTGTILIAVDA
jgi:protocatechuate 3,4-dioxygenase beta subunit